jgi:diaminopimelate epimerase
MQLRFAKMHGLGNDFMVIDRVSQHFDLEPELVRRWADRHTGVGFDQLLAVEPPGDPEADFRYRIFNADGSEAEQCGNGARCFARFVADNQLSVKDTLVLETNGGPISTTLKSDDQVEVDMGVPSTQPADVPFEADTRELAYLVNVDNCRVAVTPVSVGNPHAVIFVDSVADAPVASLGAALSRHDRFPEGANVGFCQVVDRGFARLRVFERGVGETRACGTGACAAVVAGKINSHLGERVKISLPGGKVRINWPGPGSPVKMIGPACLVYEGTIDL